MHIFCATRIGGYMFLQHCSSGGHKIFDHQIGGVTKILPRYFRKFMTPHSKENGGPLTGVDVLLVFSFIEKGTLCRISNKWIETLSFSAYFTQY